MYFEEKDWVFRIWINEGVGDLWVRIRVCWFGGGRWGGWGGEVGFGEEIGECKVGVRNCLYGKF